MTEILLRHSDQTAVVETHGGRVRDYVAGGIDVLAGHEDPEQFAYRGSLLAPWPNRVTEGRWSWAGEDLQLERDDPTGVDAALHGLVVDAEFAVVEATETRVLLRHDLAPSPGYPFALQLDATYALDADGLACSLTATNTGDRAAPVGLGVHPYVAAPGLVDDVVLTLPASTQLVTDEAWRAVERRPVDGTDVDFRRGRRIGDAELDTAFTDVLRDEDGLVRMRAVRPDGREVVVWGGETCRWLLLFTGHALKPPQYRRSMALEPMTCPPNALATGETDVVAPGAALTLRWGFALSRVG